MMAPKSVHIGPVARIGATNVIGRCFRAKNENIQEVSTITDFKNICRCSIVEIFGMKKLLALGITLW